VTDSVTPLVVRSGECVPAIATTLSPRVAFVSDLGHGERCRESPSPEEKPKIFRIFPSTPHPILKFR